MKVKGVEHIRSLRPGRLMDEAIVYMVMGWTIEPWSDEGMGGYDLHDENGNLVHKWDGMLGSSIEGEPYHRWSPSTDDAAALEALRHFGSQNTDRTYELEWFAAEDVWYCGLGKNAIGYATAKTLPLAICHALLVEIEGTA